MECSKDPLEVCLTMSIDESHNDNHVELEEYAYVLKGSEFHSPRSHFKELGEGSPLPKPSMEICQPSISNHYLPTYSMFS